MLITVENTLNPLRLGFMVCPYHHLGWCWGLRMALRVVSAAMTPNVEAWTRTERGDSMDPDNPCGGWGGLRGLRGRRDLIKDRGREA